MRRLTRNKLHPIRKDERGAAAIEFAIVASTFFMLMMGVIEYGMIQFTKVSLESALIQVSRSAGIGSVTSPGCADRVCEIKALIAKKTAALIDPQSVIITTTVVTNKNTDTPPVPDICLDNANDPYPASCGASYIENSGNPAIYDPPGALSVGDPEDLVEIRVTYLWKVLFPLFNSMIGDNGKLVLTSSTVVKNEPF